MSLHLILTFLYWIAGAGLLIWANIGYMRFGPEGGIGPITLLNFLAMPIALP